MYYHELMNTLRFLIRSAASLIALLLLIVFVIRVFAPGNADTAAIFKLLANVQPLLDTVTGWLVYPMQVALDWLTPYFPQWLKDWFPITQAAGAFHALGELILKIPNLASTELGKQLKAVEYGRVFPGVLDWRLWLAIGLWGLVESLLLKLVIRIEARLYRQRIRHRDAEMMRSLRDK